MLMLFDGDGEVWNGSQHLLFVYPLQCALVTCDLFSILGNDMFEVAEVPSELLTTVHHILFQPTINNVGSSLLQVIFFVHTLPVVFWMSEWSRHQPIHLPGRNKQNKHLEHKYNYSLRFNCFPVIFFRKYSNRFPGAAEGLNEWKDIRWFLMMIGGRSTA